MVRTLEYIDDEYQTKLHELVDELDGIPYPSVESIFLDQCESLRADLKDGAPIGVIRRAAYSNTRSHFRSIRRGDR